MHDKFIPTPLPTSTLYLSGTLCPVSVRMLPRRHAMQDEFNPSHKHAHFLPVHRPNAATRGRPPTQGLRLAPLPPRQPDVRGETRAARRGGERRYQ